MLQGLAEKYSPTLHAGLKEHSQDLYIRLASLQMPENHSSIDDSGANAFEVGTEMLLQALVEKHPHTELERNSYIADGMIAPDIAYQKPDVGRSHRASDIHLSYFRDYVLLAKPTGSKAFDKLFADVKQQFFDKKLDRFVYERFDHLVSDWEAVHPDEIFLPSEEVVS